MSTLLRERLDPGIEVLRLNRPEQRNALDRPTLALAEAAIAELHADETLRVVVFSTTSSRALCAGADVAEPLDAAGGVERMEAFTRLYEAVEALPVPTICVCVGNCVGAGAELVAGADLRVAGANLKLAWAGGRLGVPVGVARLVPLVGLARAKELIYSGRTIGADEAQALGLLADSVAEDDAEPRAIALAAELAQRPAAGLRKLKEMFRDFEDTAGRIARENEILVDYQRHGAGLPSG
jgi:enoyl-CoA hydratase/carnithine racemase